MQKMAIFTLAGLALGSGGIFIGYFFLKSIDNGANFIFLILSLVLIIVSIVCFFMATKPKKSDAAIVNETEVEEKTAQAIEQNNTVLAKWNKTNETRDRLKILKIAGVEDEEKAQE